MQNAPLFPPRNRSIQPGSTFFILTCGSSICVLYVLHFYRLKIIKYNFVPRTSRRIYRTTSVPGCIVSVVYRTGYDGSNVDFVSLRHTFYATAHRCCRDGRGELRRSPSRYHVGGASMERRRPRRGEQASQETQDHLPGTRVSSTA